MCVCVCNGPGEGGMIGQHRECSIGLGLILTKQEANSINPNGGNMRKKCPFCFFVALEQNLTSKANVISCPHVDITVLSSASHRERKKEFWRMRGRERGKEQGEMLSKACTWTSELPFV